MNTEKPEKLLLLNATAFCYTAELHFSQEVAE